MSKTLFSPRIVRASVGAAILTLVPGLLLAQPRPDGDSRGRRAERTVVRAEGPARSAESRVAPRTRTVRRTAPPVRPVPAPRVVHDHRGHAHGHRHAARCTCVTRVIPGHYETRYETVRIPGHYELVRVPSPRIRFGRYVDVEICEPRYERVWVAATVRKVPRQVWVPARTVVVETCRTCRIDALRKHAHRR